MCPRLPVLLAALFLGASSLLAQDYSGTYSVASPQGGTVTLNLSQDASGSLTGTMAGSGVQFQVEGMIEEGIAVGAMYNQEGGVLFEAQLQGNELLLSLFDVGPDGTPNYEQAREVVMTRSGAAVAPGVGAPSRGNPVGAGNPLAGGGDPFTGDYSGEGIALSLQGRGGTYTGTMTFQGTDYPVNASAAGSHLSGSFSAGGQSYSFEADLVGDQLSLASGGTTYSLARQGGGGATPANPLAGGGATGGGAGTAGGSGLLGSWSCQVPEGVAQLEFHSESELSFNGERTQYTMGQGALQVMEEWGPVEYRYQLSGETLSVSASDGTSMRCTRAGQAQRSAPGAGGGGGGMERLLQGEKCGYSASPDGGFSTTRRLFFDGRGRFVYTTLSEVDVPEVIGYGQAAGDPGSYRVIGTNRGDEVHLDFDNGDRVVMYVHHLYQGTIMELWYNDIVYAPGLCPGG
jgi:hypothetical protein